MNLKLAVQRLTHRVELLALCFIVSIFAVLFTLGFGVVLYSISSMHKDMLVLHANAQELAEARKLEVIDSCQK